jgi:hypothetical protein
LYIKWKNDGSHILVRPVKDGSHILIHPRIWKMALTSASICPCLEDSAFIFSGSVVHIHYYIRPPNDDSFHLFA